ncbi:hypothetical protein PORY_001862 [Pneumocystis oryctolagi]|uniref:Uncharacterized protein n=1 Tax=Pneumocystis oryctolagi TaxID=42067 RepID=A0ACB7CAR7_9ASCO|nr:hypothetical protein PORY_001862 [Pneumocystis oryctolagi]
MSNKYSVILPTYKEQRNLPIVTYFISKTLDSANLDWELIIVDDNSPDKTQEVAIKLIEIYGEHRIILKTRERKLGLGDVTGSFRLYKKEVLEKIIVDSKSKGYVFQMEIIVKAKKHGYSIGEVPITFIDRLYGESKLGTNEIIGYIRGLWKEISD